MTQDLSPAEVQLLSVAWRVARRGDVPNREGINRLARARLDIALDWDQAYGRLLKRGLIRREGDCYYLTPQGQTRRERAEQAYPFLACMYDVFFSRARTSSAHAQFCDQVYGRDLCQHGLADMAQVAKLVEVLRVRAGKRLLDLGCGNGMISEYISDVTGAQVTGIDVSRVGIQQAIERTREVRQRLAFEAGNLNTMALPQGAFDAILLIDTIYFLDQESILRRAKAALKPGGQMGIFFTQWWHEGDPKEILQPESTELAALLDRCGLRFETWDYSAAEDAHWRKKLEVLGVLEPAFKAESNTWLYEFRRREAAGHPTKLSWENRSRHLYRVWQASGHVGIDPAR